MSTNLKKHWNNIGALGTTKTTKQYYGRPQKSESLIYCKIRQRFVARIKVDDVWTTSGSATTEAACWKVIAAKKKQLGIK